jgi:hypothetical protein
MSRNFLTVESARLGTAQNITATASTSVSTSAFGAQTYQIRVAATAAVNIRIGDGSPTATTTDSLLPANWIEYITVNPGQRLAATGAASTINVTEITQ